MKKIDIAWAVDLALLAIGFIAAVIFRLNALVVNVACSIIASAFVGLINLIANGAERKATEITQDWGLEGIYEDRTKMNVDEDKELAKATSQLDYVGFGFSSLRNQKDEIMRKKAVEGVSMRFLVMNPESGFLREREKAENKAEGSIKKSIYDLKAWIEELRALAPNPDNVQLRFYDALPLDFYSRVDANVYFGPYWYHKDSQSTISYKYKGGSEGFRIYTKYFENLWMDKSLSVDAF